MAFGFPAYHEEKFSQPQFGGDLLGLAGQIMIKLGWKPISGTPDSVTAKSSYTFLSYGEYVTVKNIGLNQVSIRSECLLATQCIDYGKNKKNVLNVLAKLAEETQTAYWQRPQ